MPVKWTVAKSVNSDSLSVINIMTVFGSQLPRSGDGVMLGGLTTRDHHTSHCSVYESRIVRPSQTIQTASKYSK